MSQGAKCVALKCPGNDDSLCRHSKVREGLDMYWHRAGTEKQSKRKRDKC